MIESYFFELKRIVVVPCLLRDIAAVDTGVAFLVILLNSVQHTSRNSILGSTFLAIGGVEGII